MYKALGEGINGGCLIWIKITILRKGIPLYMCDFYLSECCDVLLQYVYPVCVYKLLFLLTGLRKRAMHAPAYGGFESKDKLQPSTYALANLLHSLLHGPSSSRETALLSPEVDQTRTSHLSTSGQYQRGYG